MSETKTTLGQLLAAEPALARLADLRIPVKPAYHLAKLLKLVRVEIQQFHEQRHAVVRELGVEREPTGAERAQHGPGAVMEVAPGNLPEFRRRLDELSAIEVTLPWTPIDIASLGAVDISAGDLDALGPLVTMNETPDAP